MYSMGELGSLERWTRFVTTLNRLGMCSTICQDWGYPDVSSTHDVVVRIWNESQEKTI